jgi:hypothetical protein
MASLSASCVHFPLRRKDRVKHCGVCPACLGRRQALWHAGLRDETLYEIDVFDPRTASDEIPWRKMAPLNAYLLQTAELSRIANEAQAPAWILEHLRNVGVADTALECMKSLAILRRHADEWMRLIKYGTDIGYDWARRFGPVASNHRGVLA